MGSTWPPAGWFGSHPILAAWLCSRSWRPLDLRGNPRQSRARHRLAHTVAGVPRARRVLSLRPSSHPHITATTGEPFRYELADLPTTPFECGAKVSMKSLERYRGWATNCILTVGL